MNAQVQKQYAEKSKGQKVLKTIFLILLWVCMGLYLEITGPTLIDLKIRTGADYEEVATAVSGRFLGSFIGCVIGGVLVDHFVGYCDLMIGIALTGGAVATFFVPWAPMIELMWAIILFQGLFEGIINIAGQKLIMMMWVENTASPLNLLHGGFGVGSFIIPLVANPFLAVIKSPIHPNSSSVIHGSYNETSGNSGKFATEQTVFRNQTTWTIVGNGSTSNSSVASEIEYFRESRIEFAYLIAAVVTFALSFVFYIYHFIDVNEMKKIEKQNTSKRKQTSIKPFQRVKNSINPAVCVGGNALYGIAIFSALWSFFFNTAGGEIIFAKFIRAFAVEQHEFSVENGSYLNTAYWASIAIGRICGFIVARWIPVRILLLIETGGVLVFSILLKIFADNNSLSLWIIMPALALFHAPCFPTCMGWSNNHLHMTGMAICFVMLSGSLGGIAYLRLTGYLFEHFGARAFLWQVLGYGITLFVTAVILTLISSKHGNKGDMKKTDVTIHVTDTNISSEKVAEHTAML